MVGVTGVTGDPVTRSAQGREKDSAQQRNWKSVREQQRDTEFNCKRESALSRNAMVSFEASTEVKSDNIFRKLLESIDLNDHFFGWNVFLLCSSNPRPLGQVGFLESMLSDMRPGLQQKVPAV